jgi:hypothetical protein
VIDGSLYSLLEQEIPKVPLSAVSYYTALAEVLFSKNDRVGDAIALYQILRPLGYGVHIIDGDTHLNQLDIEAFAAPETPETRFCWDEELTACSSDLDLLELALKVRLSPGGLSERMPRSGGSDGH